VRHHPDLADAERWVRTAPRRGAEIEPRARRLPSTPARMQRLREEADRLLLYAMGQRRLR
jgi:hypothetical protein